LEGLERCEGKLSRTVLRGAWPSNGPRLPGKIPKYRKRVLKGKLKSYLEAHLFDIQEHHPDVEIERYGIQVDHLHLVIVIPPKYAVSDMVGKIKANTGFLAQPLKKVYSSG
jgi:hypothetical protein